MKSNPLNRPIRLQGVRQNNLKNFNVEFPSKKLSVITGLSGSGKSSLAFDTLYAEGQRRYIESLSTYTRQFLDKMAKPDLDDIQNIPPAIALEQKNSVLNSRSTVGTQTEIVDYFRLLFAKIGHTFCTTCHIEVKKQDPESILTWALEWMPEKRVLLGAPIYSADQKNSQETQDLSPSKKTSSKKGKASRAKKEAVPILPYFDSLFQILKEQGFRRLLCKTFDNHFEQIDLDEQKESIPTSKYEEIYAIIDRFKISSESLKESFAETQSRLLDSIEQSLRMGQGKMIFYHLDEDLPLSERLKKFDQRFVCPQCQKEYRHPEPHLFSFNSPMGACAQCNGFGHTLDLDEKLVVPDPSKTLKNGALDPFSKPSTLEWQKNLFRFCERQGISIAKTYKDLSAKEKKTIWYGDSHDKTFPGVIACFDEMKKWKYKLHIRVFIRRYQTQNLCTLCHGARLKAEALAVQIENKNIVQLLEMPISEAFIWLKNIHLDSRDKKIAHEIYSQLEKRLDFLNEVGVGYLALSRLTKTLSGGEYQRINLATQLGNGLCGTLYVLDEPSIGLHSADTSKLIQILKRLRDQGNTVVVVEHDLEMMKAADWLVELGPGAGSLGGQLLAQGTASQLIQLPESLTGKYLSGERKLIRDRAARPSPQEWIEIEGCRENNLKIPSIQFPLKRWVVVTGVSGSGKSTLVHKTLYESLNHLFYRSTESVGKYDKLYGAENIQGVVLLDQTSIGKNSRSNPATYLKIWEEIRKILSSQALAIKRGYTPQFFSFNVDGGRCPICKGEGEVAFDMHFMAEVKLPCEECQGKRFKKKILDVTYKNKNVDQILHMTIDEAYTFFLDQSTLRKKLTLLKNVGLGYLQLGQSSTTLSGGESQRLKIAATLDDRTAQNLLYIFDEPTTGLHLEDIQKLITVIQDLVDAGHSVIMIEHHLDLIAQADWVIDLGPGGGIKGGELLGVGRPKDLSQNPKSITGKILLENGY